MSDLINLSLPCFYVDYYLWSFWLLNYFIWRQILGEIISSINFPWTVDDYRDTAEEEKEGVFCTSVHD